MLLEKLGYEVIIPEHLKVASQDIAAHALLFEEFISREIEAKWGTRDAFSAEQRLIKLHGHCHQKALSSFPENYKVQLIPSGCCGMAGSFGYEEEHYEVSMQVGELVLFPTVRQQPVSYRTPTDILNHLKHYFLYCK